LENSSACTGDESDGNRIESGNSFMEDYTYHFDPSNPMVLGAHMLEIMRVLADGKPSCEIHPLGIGGKADPVRLVLILRRLSPQRIDDRYGKIVSGFW